MPTSIAAPAAGDRDGLRERVLLASLTHVTFDGWTLHALCAGAEDAGVDPAQVPLLFDGGVAQAVELFSRWADAEMLGRLGDRDMAGLRVRDRIACAVRVRLEALAPYQEAVRRGLSFLALPQNGLLGARLVHRTADAVWYAAGDRSADSSYYSKRTLLAGVLTATTLYWIGDRSDGHADSWTFLDRRIDDVLRIGRTIGRMPDLRAAFSLLPSPGRFARHLRTPTAR
jgi:ubiquinone biosynthesis protein COQ9